MADAPVSSTLAEALARRDRNRTAASSAQTPPPVTPETGARKPLSAALPSSEVVPMPLPGEVAPQPLTAPPSSPPEARYVVPTDPFTLDKSAGLPTAQTEWYKDPVMSARAVLDGLTFGFSDEIGAGMAAAFALALQPAPVDAEGKKVEGGWKQYKAVYSDMMGQLQNERNIYTANNPKASLALEITGGLLSPANRAIAFLGKKTLQAAATGGDRLAVLIGKPNLTRTQRALARQEALPRPGGTLGVQGLERAVTPPGLTTRVAQRTAEAIPGGAIAGAVYSAGVAAPGTDRLAAAGEGAAWGAGLAMPFANIVPLFKTLTRRRVAQTLDTPGGFVPLTLAAGQSNPFLGWVYRNLVGKAFIGTGMLDNQASRWYTPYFKKIDNFASSLAEAKKLLANTTTAITNSAAAEARRLSATVLQTSRANRRAITRDFSERIAKLRENAAVAEIASTAPIQMFRSQALQAALPSSFPKEVRDAILEAAYYGRNTRTANDLLAKAWTEHGFAMVDDNTFKIGAIVERQVVGEAPLLGGPRPVTTERGLSLSPVLDKLEAALDVEDLAALTQPGNKLEFVRNEVDRFLRQLVDKEGNISGASLATLRNMISGLITPGRLSGQQSATDAQMRNVWIELKNVLDDVVLNQLSPDERASFLEHKAAYSTRLAVDEAITQTRASGGAFEPSDWDNALRKRFRKLWGRGRAPLQEESAIAADTVARAEAAIVEASQQARAIAFQQELIELNNKAVALEAEAARARAEVERIRTSIPNAVAGSLFATQRTGAIQAESAVKAAEQQLQMIETQRAQLIALLPTAGGRQLNPGQQWTSTLLLNLYGLAGAVPTVLGAASPTGQRVIAGQTTVQQHLDDLIRDINLTPAAAVVGGAETSNREGMTTILRTTSPARRAAIYESLVRGGNLEAFRKVQPEATKRMEEDYKRLRER